jgi:hypothetical protein
MLLGISFIVALVLVLWPFVLVGRFASEQKVEVGTIFGNAFLLPFTAYPWNFIVVLVMVGIGLVAGAIFGLLSDPMPFALLGAVAVPFWFCVWLVCKNVKANSSKFTQVKSTLVAALPDLDYFYSAEGNAIGACVRTSEIAWVAAGAQSARKLAVSKLTSAAAVQPELVQMQVMGARGIQGQDARLEAAQYNLEQRREQHVQTGLALKFDDIHQPSAHITMSYAGAQQWAVLLDQLARGVLPAATPAHQIPTP